MLKHRGPHHPSLHRHPGVDLVRRLEELINMGAVNEDLHPIIDAVIQGIRNNKVSSISFEDPGTGSPEAPINPLDRANAIAVAYGEAAEGFVRSLNEKQLVVAGEYPPHLLDVLLQTGAKVCQVHPTDHTGGVPMHFHRLSALGLIGLTNLHELAGVECDYVLFEGFPVGSGIRVSPLVQVVTRMFPDAEQLVLVSDHCAPHMIVQIDDHFARVPL